MFNKGDIVLVKAYSIGLTGVRGLKARNLYTFKYPQPIKGIILGYSFIREGVIKGGDSGPYDLPYETDPPYLVPTKDVKVWVIEPLKKGNRYLKIIKALEEDIKLIRSILTLEDCIAVPS